MSCWSAGLSACPCGAPMRSGAGGGGAGCALSMLSSPIPGGFFWEDETRPGRNFLAALLPCRVGCRASQLSTPACPRCGCLGHSCVPVPGMGRGKVRWVPSVTGATLPPLALAELAHTSRECHLLGRLQFMLA